MLHTLRVINSQEGGESGLDETVDTGTKRQVHGITQSKDVGLTDRGGHGLIEIGNIREAVAIRAGEECEASNYEKASL